MGKARNIADLLNSSGKIDSADIDSSAQFYQFKNRIINGAMVIDQRNAGASVTILGSGYYTVDRFSTVSSQSSKMSLQQSSVTPTGFTNSLAVTSLSSYSILSSDYFNIDQRIEGLNVSDLGWGTANASTVTLSFWVRSSLTGTFGGSVLNGAGDRSYPFSYTILAANTWEQKTITIAGDTTGTWLKTNGIGLRLSLGLGVGSTYSGTAGSWSGSLYLSSTGATSVVGTNGATFYITGVQLEKGSTATSFDYRPYGTELQLCQRYLPVLEGNSVVSGFAYATTAGYFAVPFSVPARTAPTGISVTGVGSLYTNAGGNLTVTATNFIVGGITSGFIQSLVSSGLTQGQGTLYYGPRILFNGCEL